MQNPRQMRSLLVTIEGSHGSSISCITASEGGFAEVGEVEAGGSPRVNPPGSGEPPNNVGGLLGENLDHQQHVCEVYEKGDQSHLLFGHHLSGVQYP
jgi:hypothetical protein